MAKLDFASVSIVDGVVARCPCIPSLNVIIENNRMSIVIIGSHNVEFARHC